MPQTQKKIVLINPPIEDFFQTKTRQQPVGLRYIQAALNNDGFITELIDCLESGEQKTIPIPPHFHFLKEYYPQHDLSPFKLFTHYRHFGISFEKLKDRIRLSGPDFIGISVNFTPYYDMAIKTARICKSLFPNVPVIAGGHHATAEPASLLSSGSFDFVVMGEGEISFLRLIQTLSLCDIHDLSRLEGIAFSNECGIQFSRPKAFIQNLNDLPKPELAKSANMIITSRGCPKNCNFCSISKVMGKKVRFRSVSAVLDEIEAGIKKGITQFDFEDDNLTINPNRAKEIFQGILNRFGSRNLKLSALNGILTDTLDEELVQLMSLAGFEWLNIPLVSGSQTMHEKLDRLQSRKNFENVVFWGKKYELKIVAYIILGLPEDILGQMLSDINDLAYLPVLTGPSIFYPPPGSVTFQNCVEKGYISGKDFTLYRSSALPVETENFSRRDLVTLFRIVRAVNFLKYILDEKLQSRETISDYLAGGLHPNEDIVFSQKLYRDEIGRILLYQLFKFKKLRGLKFISNAGNKYQYQWIEYNINQKLLEQWLNIIDIDRILPVN